MIRRYLIISLSMVAAMSAILFKVKYKVMDLEKKHKQIRVSIRETRESLDVLKAEWSHLNDPKRLQNLAKKYLPDFAPISGAQMVSFEQVMSSAKSYDKKALEDLVRKAAEESSQREKEG
jgi:hypothetical protein